jgi:hypothetical protein
MRVKAHRTVVTQGTYMGEEGTGYGLDEVPSGDLSRTYQGRLQGYQEACEIEVLVAGARFATSEGGDLLLYLPEDTYDEEGNLWPSWQGMTAADAISYGFARVVKEEGGG